MERSDKDRNDEAARIKRLTNIIVNDFDISDWEILSKSIPTGELIKSHKRLFGSMYNENENDPYCVAQVINIHFSKPNPILYQRSRIT